MAHNGLQPVEPVTSARIFDPALLSLDTGTPETPAILHAPASIRDIAPPASVISQTQSRDEMVKWFGILGFIILLTRGARRR